MLLSVLFPKPSVENFVSQQRETQAQSSELFHGGGASWELSTQDLICEWPSVPSRATMRLIDENLHCLCSRSQRSHCTKGALSRRPTSHLCRKYTSIMPASQIYCFKVTHIGRFMNISEFR